MKLLLFSDVHSDHRALERLAAIEADYYFSAGDLVSWGRGLERCGEILAPLAEKLFVIPGNHESTDAIAAFCERFGFRDLHGRTVELGGHTLAALGYSNPTPFHTPGEYAEPELARRLASFAELNPEILVCHCPPRGTPLDRARPGVHFGSDSVRDFLEQHPPRYFFCGHVHEAEGAEIRLGETLAVNVGKRGYLLELEDA